MYARGIVRDCGVKTAAVFRRKTRVKLVTRACHTHTKKIEKRQGRRRTSYETNTMYIIIIHRFLYTYVYTFLFVYNAGDNNIIMAAGYMRAVSRMLRSRINRLSTRYVRVRKRSAVVK